MPEYEFGIPVAGGTNWLMQNVTESDGADKGEARDGNGNVAAVKHYNAVQTLSASMILPTGTEKPAVGTPFTYNGTVYLVDSCTKTSSNQDYVRYDLAATRYVANGIPTQSSSSSSASA